MTQLRLPIVILAIVISVLITVLWQFRSSSPRYFASVTEALSTDQDLDEYQRALAVSPIEFPRDAGPHDRFQTEWWYYTGNLNTPAGRHFGYQLTIFRRALSARAPDRQSTWATNQLYFAHFALTDTKAENFHSFERFSRQGAELSGAQADPFRVWIEDWQIKKEGDHWKLFAAQAGISIQLILKPGKRHVLQGNKGLSQKSAEPGNASYYYSRTRMPSHGTIEIQSDVYTVTGFSWLDREWSTSALSKQESGWDWFALQFTDGRELMMFQIRQADGTASPYSAGSLVLRDGNVIKLKNNDFKIRVIDHWKSSMTEATYPAGWEVSILKQNLKFQITPYLANQEHRHSFAYWEGAVKVTGDGVEGNGYVELTGYVGK